MNKLLKYWNANKRKILITIGVIVLIFVCIQIANQIVRQQNLSKQNEQNTINKVHDIKKPTQTVITEQKLSTKTIENNTQLIEEFVNACNEQNIEQAYSMLSEDCQEEFDLNSFNTMYLQKIFTSLKEYRLEAWISEQNSTTYKITYFEGNLLATGGIQNETNIEDYITIVSQKGENRININSLIRVEKINKTKVLNNIEMTINSRKVYKDYEMFSIAVKNNTEKTILLSSGSNYNICLIGENDTKYPAFLNEMLDTSLEVQARQQKEIEIRFSKIYNPYRTIKQIEFNNIILDKEKHIQNATNENSGIITMTITL